MKFFEKGKQYKIAMADGNVFTVTEILEENETTVIFIDKFGKKKMVGLNQMKDATEM